MEISPVQILGRLSNEEFFDRNAELERLCGVRPGGIQGRTALLLGAPRIGKTELLRKSFDRVFADRTIGVPVFYSFNTSRLEPAALAEDYLAHFLSQFVAFRNGDSRIASAPPEPIGVIMTAAAPQDYVWIKRLIEAFSRARASGEPETMTRLAISAPALAGTHSNISCFVVLDNAHLLLDERARLARVEFAKAIVSYTGSPDGAPVRPSYVLSGLRRPLLRLLPPEDDLFDSLDLIRIGPISEEALEQLISRRAAALSIAISDSTTELMIQQLRGDLLYTRAILAAAAARGRSLKTFMEFERVYTEEVLDGRIGGYLDALMREIAPEPHARKSALNLLGGIIEGSAPVLVESLIDRVSVADAEGLLERLSDREFLNLTAGSVTTPADPVLADYLRARYRSEVAGHPRPIAGEELLGDKLKDSYRLMMSRYNRAVESQLVELLTRFDFQSAPAALFQSVKFAESYQGVSRVNARRMLEEEQERIRLPQIVYVSDLGSGEQTGLAWRLFSGRGFDGGIYSESNETQWLIALINSKEPLDLETLKSIENRMGAATGKGGFSTRYALPESRQSLDKGKIVRWLISKEGFTRTAADRIAETNAHSSTYAQLDLLCDFIHKLDDGASAVKPSSQFELVIPIEDDSELIAARTAEQIARAADFDQQAISQIKTALIEACLNAAEHGDSPDRRIYQRFRVTEDRLVITVLNKGNRFAPDGDGVRSTAPGKRGRGLQIIRALMDDCVFERTDDGTSLVMTKFLKRPDNQQ